MSDDETLKDTANSDGHQLAASPAQPHTDALNNWPPLPDGITIAAEVDLTAPDPCYVPNLVNAGSHRTSHRRCVATRRDGNRCAGRAAHHSLLCSLHAGRMTPQQGHAARRAQGAERQAHAASVLQLQRLGTRAVIAETLVAQAGNVQKAVTLLCEAAGSGDLAAAKALVPYLDQALGKPTERHELRVPSSVDEIEQLSTEELASLVAEGRRKRLERQGLQASPDTADWRRRDPSLGVVDGDVPG